MKRIIGITLLAILFCQVGNSQSLNRLFNEFSSEKDASIVKLGPAIMGFSRLFADTKGVRGIEVIDLSDCSTMVKNRFNALAKNFKDSDYDVLVRSNDGKESNRVLMKTNGDYISEIVVLSTGDGAAMVRISGKIRQSDVNDVVNEQKHSRHNCGETAEIR